MAKYDFESILLDVKALLVAELNTRITAINTEKNDTISLKSVPSDAYFIQSMDGPNANYDPFVYIGIQNIDSTAEMSASYTRSVLDIAVILVLADEGQDVEIWKRVLRYQRAIRECFEDKFDYINGAFNLSVQSQVPVELALINNSYSHKAVGVLVRVETD